MRSWGWKGWNLSAAKILKNWIDKKYLEFVCVNSGKSYILSGARDSNQINRTWECTGKHKILFSK